MEKQDHNLTSSRGPGSERKWLDESGRNGGCWGAGRSRVSASSLGGSPSSAPTGCAMRGHGSSAARFDSYFFQISILM